MSHLAFESVIVKKVIILAYGSTRLKNGHNKKKHYVGINFFSREVYLELINWGLFSEWHGIILHIFYVKFAEKD